MSGGDRNVVMVLVVNEMVRNVLTRPSLGRDPPKNQQSSTTEAEMAEILYALLPSLLRSSGQTFDEQCIKKVLTPNLFT